MRRPAVVVATAVLLLAGGTACRDGADTPIPGTGAPVERQLDDIESTLDAVESELNDG
jgi:hypothetical protein